MTVYLLIESDYCGDTILHVYDTEEKANKQMDDLIEIFPTRDLYVLSFEVE